MASSNKKARPISHQKQETANHCEKCLAYAGREQQGDIKRQKVLMYRVFGPGLPEYGKEMCKRHWEEYEDEDESSQSSQDGKSEADTSSEDHVEEYTIKPMGHSKQPNTCETCLAFAKKGEVSKIKRQRVLMFRVYGPEFSDCGREMCATHKEEYE